MTSLTEISHDKYLKITWSAAGAAAIAVIGGVLWLAGIDSKASDALGRAERQNDSIKEMRATVLDIDKRTIRMETILNELKSK